MTLYKKLMKGVQDEQTKSLTIKEINEIVTANYIKTKEYKNAGSNQTWFLNCEVRLVSEYWSKITS